MSYAFKDVRLVDENVSLDESIQEWYILIIEINITEWLMKQGSC
jgi:hypothetical protein